MASLLQNGNTALMKASTCGHFACVKLLLENGAQVNRQNAVSAVPDRLLLMCDEGLLEPECKLIWVGTM